MVYMNPGGRDYGSENLDGYGISNIVFIVIYSLFFYSACFFTWISRRHPVLRIRNVPLMLLSLLTIHVFVFAVMIVYTMNGAFPCQVEYWSMCLYLPIGIGLYQAYNQQLLLVSRDQAALITKDEFFNPIFPKTKGFGGPKYWAFRFKIWWQNVSSKGKCEGFVLIGVVIQFLVSFIIYNISRKFNHYGTVDHHTSPGLCRRGWEWVPTIAWQFSWNYIFGPYLLWNIRMIKDIYHWRLQTTLAIIAGLPGAPLWLAALYSDRFAPVNKYWVPPMWILPGLFTIEVVTLGFPIYAIFKNKKAARQVTNALADFDQKRLQSHDESDTFGSSETSLKTRASTKGSKKSGKMYPMDALDASLHGNHDGLQVYASCMELNGENIIFLVKVIEFTKQCQRAFYPTVASTPAFRRARTAMFRLGLSIFVSLVHTETASYPVNIESHIYNSLNLIFGPATALVASARARSRPSSIATPVSSKVTPWDDPAPASPEILDDAAANSEYFVPQINNNTTKHSPSSYPLRPLGSHKSSGNESSERIVVHEADDEEDGTGARGRNRQNSPDPLEGVNVPGEFDERVFDRAFQSVRYMVWTETWQRYMRWKGREGSVAED